jgi:hypothetical protein
MLFKRSPRNLGLEPMTKLLSLLIVGLMIVQIIKPLGLPGLKRRGDFWKLALAALAAISLTAALGHGN